jgi:hypothetical protein
MSAAAAQIDTNIAVDGTEIYTDTPRIKGMKKRIWDNRG